MLSVKNLLFLLPRSINMNIHTSVIYISRSNAIEHYKGYVNNRKIVKKKNLGHITNPTTSKLFG